jgi:preprotein translocase subunit YajC
MPVAVITGAAVGAVVFLVVALALIYFFRIRRRVHTMKKCTNILGPGASFHSKHGAAALS